MNVEEKCEQLIEALSINIYALMNESQEVRDNKELMLMLMKKTNEGYLLEHFSDRLKNDKEIVLATMKENGYALEYVSEELKNDEEVVLTAVKRHGSALLWANERFKNTRAVVLEAVKNNGASLYYANDKFKKDKEVILAACIQDINSIDYASLEIINEIGDNDPRKYLQSHNLYNQLNNKVSHKEEIKKLKKKI